MIKYLLQLLVITHRDILIKIIYLFCGISSPTFLKILQLFIQQSYS